MDEFTLGVFLWEIGRQSRFFLMAIQQLETALSRNDPDEAWYAIQAALIAAGNLSKIFWPANTKCAARGAALRQLLAVQDQSALSVRTFRNHFEHFDERIEQWAASDDRMIDSSVVPGDILLASASPKARFMRYFDTDGFAVMFGRYAYPLRPIAEEASALVQRVVDIRGW